MGRVSPDLRRVILEGSPTLKTPGKLRRRKFKFQTRQKGGQSGGLKRNGKYRIEKGCQRVDPSWVSPSERI